MPTPPAKSGSTDPANTSQEVVNMSTDNGNPNTRTPNLSSPLSTPASRLNIDNDGAGWATDKDFRPKPIRPRFSDLKNIECQVSREVTTKLGQITQELDLGISKTPKVLSQEDKIRVIANSVISRPGVLILTLSESLKQAMINKMIKKDITDKFDVEDAPKFFRQDNLTTFVTNNVEAIGSLFIKAAEITSSADPALKDALHTNSILLAGTFLTKVGELLTNEVHNGHFSDFCNKISKVEGVKTQNVILEGHIINMNFTTTILMALEDLPAGSPINSLQTVNDNVVTLTKKTEDLTIRVAKADIRLANTMDMVADIKSEEVSARHAANENKVRIHSVSSIINFKENSFRGKVDLVAALCGEIAGNKQLDVELITPRPAGRYFESLAIVSFPTPGHKYKFEKSFSDYKKVNPTTKLSCSRPKMVQNLSDSFESDNQMRNQIKIHYDAKLASTDSPHVDHAPLTDLQVKGIQINLKQLKGPNRSYFEFMDPSNGTFFLVYHKSINPFSDHDFTQPIANRFVRKLAETNRDYLLKFKPRVWKNNQ